MWPVSYSNSNYSNFSNNYYSNFSNTVISNSSSSNNKGHINTGYYGTSNQPRLDYRYINYGSGGSSSHKSKPTTLSLLLFKSHNTFSAGQKSNNLYAKTNQSKYCRSPNVDKNQLFHKYQTQKKAEQEFYQLQSQINHTENLLAANPHLSSFYTQWLQHAKETLKQFTNIIESPDAVTFSSVYGYSKDEELTTLYRHPVFEMELNQMGKNSQDFWKQNPNNFLYSTVNPQSSHVAFNNVSHLGQNHHRHHQRA